MSLPNLVHILFTRQRRIFVAVFIGAVAATALITFSLPKEYRATATLFVGENRPISTGANAVQLDEVLSQTYAKLLNTQDISKRVLAALPYKLTPAQLSEGKVNFQVLNGTRLIEIDGMDRDPVRAQQLANTYADVFVASQQQSAVEAAKARLEQLNDRIGELVTQITELEGEDTPAAAARLAQAENELSAARDSYKSTQENITLQGSNVTVSSRASPPDSPYKPRPKLYLALGLVLGFTLAAVAALIRDVFDKRLRSEEELSQLLGAPVLAAIPVRRSASSDGHLAEAFQFLRANLQLQDPREETRMIAITSARPGDGKTMVTNRLAAALSATGADVTAVDCDLRKPRLAKSFEMDGAVGVTTVLTGACSVDEASAVDEETGVRVLPSGPLPPDPAVLLSTTVFRDMLDELRRESQYVVVDTPPVIAGADASAVATAVDGIILVVDLQTTRRDVLLAARDQLRKSDAQLLGVVLNRVPDTRAPYGYYYADEVPEQTVAAGNGAPSGRRRTSKA